VQNIAAIAPLFKDQHWTFSIVHKAGADINPMAEIVEKMAQVARFSSCRASILFFSSTSPLMHAVSQSR
jgi:hypothetical protein